MSNMKKNETGGGKDEETSPSFIRVSPYFPLPLLRYCFVPEHHVHVLRPREAQQSVLEPRRLTVHPCGPGAAGPVPLVEGIVVVRVVAAEREQERSRERGDEETPGREDDRDKTRTKTEGGHAQDICRTRGGRVRR